MKGKNIGILIIFLPSIKYICGIRYYNISQLKMLGQNKTLKSTFISSKASSVAMKKDGFFVYTYKRMWQLLCSLWNRTRRFLWISSTGTCLLI